MHISKTTLSFSFHLLMISLLFSMGFIVKSQSQVVLPKLETSGEIDLPPDQPIDHSQKNLLNLAIQAASKIPIKPHIKDRSKTQENVVEACLKLDLPHRALEYSEKIGNWRRGYCYASLAFYCAKQGKEEVIDLLIDKAKQIAMTTQDWRGDRIKVRIAQVHAYLGHNQKAEQVQTGVIESETGKVEQVKAARGKESFDEMVSTLDGYITTENFDIIRNSLKSYAQLYQRFYKDKEKRELIEERIRSSLKKVPVFIRIDLLTEMTKYAIDNSDRDKAFELINDAKCLVDENQWRLEHKLPLLANLAELRYKAGAKKQAIDDADAALALYENEGKKIVNIWRAGALRPLAQAYHAMGLKEQALEVYALAIEEGIENPNSRPQAEDLSATCVSMALHSVKPNHELWSLMQQIYKGLSKPW